MPDTPQSVNQNISVLDKVSYSQSEDSEFQEKFPKIAKLHWSNSQPFCSGYTKAKYPELEIGTHPDILVEPKFSASSIFEWNIDRMTEYQILNSLQQMTMASNAYKTQTGTSDRSVAELIITGFSGQLKGWWDYYLIIQQQTDILIFKRIKMVCPS